MESSIRQESILIIDSESETTTLLASVLKNSGFSTTQARSAEEALIHLFARHFDLVFLSSRLPDRDGFQLLPEIQIYDPHTPILIMIHQDAIERAMEALRQGASDYLVKPLDPNQIIGYVSMLLKGSERTQ